MSEIHTPVAGFSTIIPLNNRCPFCKLWGVNFSLGLVGLWRYMKMRSLICTVALTLGFVSIAHANSGQLLPLDQYQAGTEQTSNALVTNGTFENTTAGQPAGWTPLGTFQSAAPIGANTSPAVNGNFAAQDPLGSALQRNGYQQNVALAANTDYILSGYAWNFSPINFDLVLVELRDSVDPSIVRNFSLAPLDNS